ncbi:MAG: choice-of-anchor D domain-containing protein [bacterium]
MKKISLIPLLLFSFAAGRAVQAASFNPATSAQLQADLNTAATNGDASNTITLNANTVYSTSGNGNAPFSYSSSNNSALTIAGAGAASTVLDGGGMGGSQVMNLSLGAGANSPVLIQALTFQNGNATTSGGGLFFNSQDASLTVQNCQFTNNQVSGSMINGGGASLASTNASITFNSNVLTGNQSAAGEGGGVIIVGSNTGAITFNQNTFTGNKAVAGDDGAAAVRNDNGSITANGNTFTGNSSGNTGGGLELQTDGGNIVFNQNNVLHNTCDGNYGGAHLQSNSGSISADANTFLGNTANGMGAGGLILGTNGPIAFTNNILSGNKVPSGNAGGAFVYLSSTGNTQLINNTFTQNSAGGFGGGLQISTLGGPGLVNLYNNIFFGNGGTAGEGKDLFADIQFQPTTVIKLFNNDLAEGCIQTGPATVNCDFVSFLGANQGNNINQDPLFIDAAGGNFYLSGNSPAAATGDVNAPALPAKDHDGNLRTTAGTVNMGALEGAPKILVNPLSLDFGQVAQGQTGEQTVSIGNQGSIPLQVTGLTLSDAQNFFLDAQGGASPCGTLTPLLPPGQSCTIGVGFSPTLSQALTGILTIASDDPSQPTVSVALSGTGTGISANLEGSGCSMGGPASATGWTPFLSLPFIWSALRLRRRS